MICWLMSAALISSLVRCYVQIRKSERVTQLCRHGRGNVYAMLGVQWDEFLEWRKCSEGKNVTDELTQKQSSDNRACGSHLKRVAGVRMKSLCGFGSLPNRMFPLERRTTGARDG